jgi:hypothetical protein
MSVSYGQLAQGTRAPLGPIRLSVILLPGFLPSLSFIAASLLSRQLPDEAWHVPIGILFLFAVDLYRFRSGAIGPWITFGCGAIVPC